MANIQTPNRFLCLQEVQLIRSGKIFLGRRGPDGAQIEGGCEGLGKILFVPSGGLQYGWHFASDSVSMSPLSGEWWSTQHERKRRRRRSCDLDLNHRWRMMKRKKLEADKKDRFSLMRFLTPALMSPQYKSVAHRVQPADSCHFYLERNSVNYIQCWCLVLVKLVCLLCQHQTVESLQEHCHPTIWPDYTCCQKTLLHLYLRHDG